MSSVSISREEFARYFEYARQQQQERRETGDRSIPRHPHAESSGEPYEIPDLTDDDLVGIRAGAEQDLATMREAERRQTPNIWAGDTFVGRSQGVVGKFRRHRRAGQIRFEAPRLGGLPKYNDDDSEMNGRYTIVLFEAKPYEAHVCRGPYTLREVLRRNRPRRCEVGDHSGATQHLVLVRGQFAVVWSMCDLHAEAALDHPARNKEWAMIARAYKSGVDPRSLIGDM